MHRWYHKDLNSEKAEELLKQKISGSFLVRPSKRPGNKGEYRLLIKRDNLVAHLKIRKVGDYYDMYREEQFTTLHDLIQHYSENKIVENSGEVFELRYPIASCDPITDRWFHGPIHGGIAEKMILENGVYGTFLVRDSHSRLGDYVLIVCVKDEKNERQLNNVVIFHHDNIYDVGGGPGFCSLKEFVEHYRQEYRSMVESTGYILKLERPLNTTRITASYIDDRIKELSKENDSQIEGQDGFWEEFEHLQQQECKVFFNRKVGQEDRNMSKNRYKNILPFDYTRVILKKRSHSYINDDNSTRRSPISTDGDYINANYIKLVEDQMHISDKSKPMPHSKVYIATQGPLPNTVDDFWWMVWQERSECILMATKEVERDKNKCFRYWPTLEQEVLLAGTLEIKIVAESFPAKTNDRDYIRREFELRHIKACENIRKITQYQYLAWPDQNTPSDPDSVLSFLQDINSHQLNGTMIVHCSAGIGRSGTLIVIDMLLDQLRRRNSLNYDIDIQSIVKTVRAQRSGLVQTEAQYKFIYLAIQKYIALRMEDDLKRQ